MMLARTECPSPIGDLTLALRNGRLCALAFANHWPRTERGLTRRVGALSYGPATDCGPLLARLRDYFAGDVAALDAIEVDAGGTPFQSAVWAALRRVPAGQTTSYAALARAVGAPAAVRAVGAANGANPIALVIPCHRAIGSDGRLVGYAGGIERKQWLLAHEGGGREWSSAST